MVFVESLSRWLGSFPADFHGLIVCVRLVSKWVLLNVPLAVHTRIAFVKDKTHVRHVRHVRQERIEILS